MPENLKGLQIASTENMVREVRTTVQTGNVGINITPAVWEEEEEVGSCAIF